MSSRCLSICVAGAERYAQAILPLQRVATVMPENPSRLSPGSFGHQPAPKSGFFLGASQNGLVVRPPLGESAIADWTAHESGSAIA
jgi:hypothetical protein